MPKQKLTKEMVVNAAFELAREGGEEKITVKNIARKLSCSVQPIYFYCKNMEGLKQEVNAKITAFVHEYAACRTDKDDLFRSTGNAYITLAKEEPHIYKMFILRPRSGISSLNDLYLSETTPMVAESISKQLNISLEAAKQLHVNMLIYTIGIGTIFSVSTPGISPDEISEWQENAFKAFTNKTERNDHHE